MQLEEVALMLTPQWSNKNIMMEVDLERLAI